MDGCKQCIYCGDLKKCQSVDCSHHKTWYAEALQSEIYLLTIENEALNEDYTESCKEASIASIETRQSTARRCAEIAHNEGIINCDGCDDILDVIREEFGLEE